MERNSTSKAKLTPPGGHRTTFQKFDPPQPEQPRAPLDAPNRSVQNSNKEGEAPGFNSTLRQGNVTHHEYIQVGKGRDVGLKQIALFEGKVAGGNGEQVLCRDIYRLGQLFDFFRMFSFFFTTVGFYVCTMMTVLTVYIFLHGWVHLAFSGLDEQIVKQTLRYGNTALDAALKAQFLV